MRNDRPTTGTDRRLGPGLAFDAATGRLAIGSFAVTIPGADNPSVLHAYLELVARCRGDRMANVLQVRQDDVDALAKALDLDAADLAVQIEHILGATRADALRLVARLKESRVIGGITKAATGAVIAGGLIAGATAVSDAGAAPASKPAVAAATTAAPEPTDTTPPPVVDGPVTEDETGVGLIPPVEHTDTDVVLIPPLSIDRDPAPGA